MSPTSKQLCKVSGTGRAEASRGGCKCLHALEQSSISSAQELPYHIYRPSLPTLETLEYNLHKWLTEAARSQPKHTGAKSQLIAPNAQLLGTQYMISYIHTQQEVAYSATTPGQI